MCSFKEIKRKLKYRNLVASTDRALVHTHPGRAGGLTGVSPLRAYSVPFLIYWGKPSPRLPTIGTEKSSLSFIFFLIYAHTDFICTFIALTEGRHCLANLVIFFFKIYLNLIFLHTCFLPFQLFWEEKRRQGISS